MPPAQAAFASRPYLAPPVALAGHETLARPVGKNGPHRRGDLVASIIARDVDGCETGFGGGKTMGRPSRAILTAARRVHLFRDTGMTEPPPRSFELAEIGNDEMAILADASIPPSLPGSVWPTS